MKYLLLVVLFFGIQTSIFSAGYIKNKDEKQKILYESVVYHHEIKVIKSIIKNGIDLNYRYHEDKTILHAAINTKCDLDLIKLLITDGNINAQDVNGERPLYLAIFSSNPLLVQLLVERGASPDLSTPDQISILEFVENMLLHHNYSQALKQIYYIFIDALKNRNVYLKNDNMLRERNCRN